MNSCGKCFFSFQSNLYFILDILSFIILCVFLKNANIFGDRCSKYYIENYETDPITDLYLSNEKTPDSLLLGYLEEFSSDKMKIHSKEIYKWKNKYINAKREKNSDPINYLTFSDNSYVHEDFQTKSLRFDSNNYLHFSTKGEDEQSLVDLKISFREELNTMMDINNNICFSKNCLNIYGECEVENYQIIDHDSSNNLINYNNIKIDLINYINLDINFYDPETFNLFKVKHINNNLVGNFKRIKQLFISYLVLNIIFRVTKIIGACFLKIENNFCSLIYLFFLFNNIINFSLFFAVFLLIELGEVQDDNTDDYLKGLNFSSFFLMINIFLESYILCFSFCLNFKMFSENPKYCSCCNLDDENYSNKIDNKNYEKEELNKQIKNIKNEVNQGYLKNEELIKNLEKLVKEKRELNVKVEKINLESYTKKKLKIIVNRYINIDNIIEETKEKLNERKKELEEIKIDFNNKNFEGIDSLLNGEKLKLNLIYFDENINADEELNYSYEFFKILKNSTDGLFFGIKEVNDYYYLDLQLPTDFKFILIYSNNDKAEANNFLEKFHSKFSDILIYTLNKNEFNDLNKYENIRTIESNYKSIILRLIQLNNNYKNTIDINKYKPYDLNLYSDYLNNNNIKECHLELLNNTIFKEDSSQLRKEEFEKGLNEEEYSDFVSFLDNDLDDGTPTLQDKIKEKQKMQFNINRDIIKDDREANIVNVPNICLKERDDEEDNKINDIRICLRERNDEEDNKNNDIVINQKKNDNYKLRMRDNDVPNINLANNDSVPDINTIERIVDVNRSNRRNILINNPQEESENRKLNIRINSIRIEQKKKEYLGTIDKAKKEKIKILLKQWYKSSNNLLKLYTAPSEFYVKLNQWLFSLNINLYRKIGPICGKIINFLYFIFETTSKENKKINNENKLYRGLVIKKADIFLYKACEGDIFFYPGFTSTTMDEKIISDFQNVNNIEMKALDEKCNCKIEIDYNLEDEDVFQEAYIKKYSEFKHEEERLFPPFSFFKIKKVLVNEENNGTFAHPFVVKLGLIKRNFYLDEAIARNKSFVYNKKMIRWDLVK